MSKHYSSWETTKKLTKLGLKVVPRDGDNTFEIWIAWKLIATVDGAGGLYQFYLELLEKGSK